MMNIESDVLKLLFDDKCDDLEDNINFKDYIWKIGTLKQDELVKEPDKLKEERATILDQTQELAVANYKTFIQTAECSQKMFDGFNNIHLKLDTLLENTPKFEEKCRFFVNNTDKVNLLRRLNSLVLTRSAHLLEVLEIPQLMESFINDGLYEDALELATYVRRLQTKHSDVPIFEIIVTEVNAAWLSMLHNLLVQLQKDLQLSQCLQIVSYLRRMEIFTEAELRLKFLQARGVWLQKCLSAIDENSAVHGFHKVIEVYRVSLFNIITQYKAIFNDDEFNSLSTTNSNASLNLIFHNWIRDKVFEFIDALEQNLMGDTPVVDSILGQCMYFGLSFSRVGCDFRPFMVPIFNKAILNNFQNAIARASRNFEKNIERFTLINKNYPSIPWKNKDNNAIQPPESLLEFYPLAEYLNETIGSFNGLRLCAPVAILRLVIECLQTSLLRVSNAIVLLYGQEQQAFTHNSRDAFVRLCLCFVDDLIPYVQKCISIIYSYNYISSCTSYSIQNLQKEGLAILNKDAIIEPIRHLLPAKVELFTNINNTEGSDKVTHNSAQSQ